MKKRNLNTCRIVLPTLLLSLGLYLTLPHRLAETQETESQTPESPVAVFTVTNNLDAGAGSFRQAILDANAQPGTDTIQFQIGTGAVNIHHNSALPDIIQPVIIDGTTQPGFSGTPLIWLSSSSNGVFRITGGGSTVKSIAVAGGFRDGGIILENGGGNIVTGCFIGICPQDPTANCGNPVNGVQIINSPNNIIGGSTAAERNIIGGNGTNGIEITGNASSGNVVTGNYIGILPDNTIKKNQSSGVVINGAPNNRVGGTTAGERNVISGNGSGSDLPANQSKSAVLISGAGATGNVVEGNYIGTTIDGTARAGGNNDNRLNGVRIENAPNNRIGGSVGTTPGGACTGACNVISGFMFRGGVYITGSGATGNSVLGNFIGTNAAGTARINNTTGVTITGSASNNTVGGTTAAGRNLINNGLMLTADAASNTVQGNYIGTDTTGNIGIGFLSGGGIIAALTIDGAPNNTIGTAAGTTLGGACTGGCNLISGNNLLGVRITGSASTGNRVDYNYIGLNAAGTAALRNNGDAITLLNGANSNIIGRPLATTPFQEIKAVEIVPSQTRRFQGPEGCIEFDVTPGTNRAYTITEFRSGLPPFSGTGEVEEVIFNGTTTGFILRDAGVSINFSIERNVAYAHIISSVFNFTVEARSTNVCVPPTEGMQIVLGTVANNASNNTFNFFS
ncbi:MAG: beta strand repeat-containing protein, partial [Blastocatellia bacterium]